MNRDKFGHVIGEVLAGSEAPEAVLSAFDTKELEAELAARNAAIKQWFWLRSCSHAV